MIACLVVTATAYAIVRVFKNWPREALSDAWLLDNQRREWAEGIVDQVCWTWPVRRIE